MPHTPVLAHDRAGPASHAPLLLVHAGIADRRMWEPLWAGLARERDVLRIDLRGFGESVARPDDGWSHVADVTATLDALGIGRAHLVGASLGAGVAVEVALTRPELVASLLLVAPGGALLTRPTDELRAFIDAEVAALEREDIDAAAAANVDWWVVSPRREADAVDPEVRALVHAMQRRAFELTADWDEIDETELDPPATDRLAEIAVPTLVLIGGLDLDAIGEAAAGVVTGVAGARMVTWDDCAHLPSLERPDDFGTFVKEWLAPLA
ncbi:MAG: alpha/beta fold hydrolase [Nocardioides sp.]